VTGRWIGVPPIHAYYLVNQLLILPLLLFSLTAATFWLWRPTEGESAGLTTLLVPLVLLSSFERWDWASYLMSESFALSLVLMLLAVPLVMEIDQRAVEGRRPGLALVQYAGLVLVSVAIVMTKASVGLLFAGGLLFITLRARLGAAAVAVAAVIAAVVIGLAVTLTAIPAYAGDPLIGPLHFFRAYPDAAFPNLWAILSGLGLGVWAWTSADRPMRLHLEFLELSPRRARLWPGVSDRGGLGVLLHQCWRLGGHRARGRGVPSSPVAAFGSSRRCRAVIAAAVAVAVIATPTNAAQRRTSFAWR